MLQNNWMKTIAIDGVAETANAQTKKIKLPTSNFIGNINLRIAATVLNAGDDAAMAARFIDQITRIKVVGNGANTILDLKPKQLRNIMAPTLGTIPPQNFTEKNDDVEWIDFPICFGRYMWDEEYILPAQLFKTLNLEVEYNLSDIADPGWDTGSMKFYVDVDEFISQKDPLSAKIIKRTEIQTGTTKSGSVDVDMPLGGTYRRIMAMLEDDDAEEGVDITKLQFRINNGAEVPITAEWINLQNQNKVEFNMPNASLAGKVVRADTAVILTDLGSINAFSLIPEVSLTGSTNIVAGGAVAGGTITADINNETSYGTAAALRLWAESKAAIPECAIIVFDKNGNMAKCPNSALWNDAKLRLTGANANGTYYVVLEEVLPSIRG